MTTRVPPYCRQHESDRPDRAFVRIDGKKVFLGRHGSPESKARYAEVIAGVSAKVDTATPIDPTVTELMVAYLEYAKRYYRTPEGNEGREYELTRDVCRAVRKKYGSQLAREFGPKRLKAVRQELIKADLSRKFINKQIDRVRSMFRWGAGEELCPAGVPLALSMVHGLRKGRSASKELPPVCLVGIKRFLGVELKRPKGSEEVMRPRNRLSISRPRTNCYGNGFRYSGSS